MDDLLKKRFAERNIKNYMKNNDISEECNDEGSENELIKKKNLEIEVEFEGHNPEDSDFHGIKTLLQQLFLKAHIDLSKLTDLIIAQNYIGSVVKQCYKFEESDSEDDDLNDIFSIITVINLSNRHNISCIQQLRNLLRQLTKKYASCSTKMKIENALDNDSINLGFLINERFVNIPTQISIPLFENLISEMNSAITKRMPYNFKYFILISKIYKINISEKNHIKKKKDTLGNKKDSSIIWSNPEEEIFAEEAICSFEFPIEEESDNALSGSWSEDDSVMVPYRQVLLIEDSKLEHIINKMKIYLT